MAEYIDREKLINDGMSKGFCDWYDEIKYASKADVVEREKIDKTIEEIEQIINHSKLPAVNIYNRYSDGLKDCLEIIKRNIGE